MKPSISREKVTILNTPCILTNPSDLTQDLSEWCTQDRPPIPLSVDFTNVHIVAMRTMDYDFHLSTSSVDWFVSDSQILSWAICLQERKGQKRVYGPDFMNYFFRHGKKEITHFFLGGSQECLEALETNLANIQPGYKLVGSRNGYFGSTEEEQIVHEINRCQPDLLWVGLGTPKQQEWIHRHKHLLNCKAILAVGFAFDVNAGTKKDAPAWLGPLGLTWFYRLICEPRRLWKRYLVYNTVFIIRLFAQQVLGKTSPIPEGPFKSS